MYRSIIIILCIFLLPLLAYSQDQNIQRLFLKDGRALSGKVVIAENGIYQIETVDGDVFYFQPDEVDGVFGLPKEKNTNKKGIKPGDVVTRHGNELRFIKNDVALSMHDFNTMAGWNKYQKAMNQAGVGKWIAIGGGGAMITGGVLMAIGRGEMQDEGLVGLFIYGAGFISGITGLILIFNAHSKLNKMANTYNQNPGYALNFGVQQNGIGLAFNF